ncbi:V-type ATPase subunit [Candidatus Margulisiibacteriota bacterium]
MDNFYYAAGRVRALEAKMMTPAQIARMAAASDFESAFAVLSETPYAENLAKLKHSFDFEELVELELKDLQDLMEHLAPETDLFDTESPLVKNMLIHKRDLANIKTLLRCQALKKDKKFLQNALQESGLIGQDVLLDLLDKTPQDIIARLDYTIYFPFITEGIEHYAKSKSFALLEKLMADFVTNQIKQAKYLSSGVEPLVGFYLAKQTKIQTLRFILICKKNFVDTEQIKQRLRLNYA